MNDIESTTPGPWGNLHLGRGTFGEAVKALEAGQMVQREGWNGKGMFVFMQIPSSIQKDIVPKMQSLPQAVKDEFAKRFQDSLVDAIVYGNQLALVNSRNEISGWSPSTSDALAKDWKLFSK